MHLRVQYSIKQAEASNLPGEVCGHYNKECTPEYESIQCDIYYVWVHAECRCANKEQFEKLT